MGKYIFNVEMNLMKYLCIWIGFYLYRYIIFIDIGLHFLLIEYTRKRNKKATLL